MMNNQGRFEEIGASVGRLVDQKNKAYGNSFHKCAEYMMLLYPNGIKPEQYKDMLGLVRDFDKNMRIVTRRDALGENPWEDKCGYSILMLSEVDHG